MVGVQQALDDRVDELSGIVVDEQLARDGSIAERHDAGVTLEAVVDNETGRQPLVDGAEVAQPSHTASGGASMSAAR